MSSLTRLAGTHGLMLLVDQPRALELGVNVVTTRLDKYGTVGPRLGVLAGKKSPA